MLQEQIIFQPSLTFEGFSLSLSDSLQINKILQELSRAILLEMIDEVLLTQKSACISPPILTLFLGVFAHRCTCFLGFFSFLFFNVRCSRMNNTLEKKIT